MHYWVEARLPVANRASAAVLVAAHIARVRCGGAPQYFNAWLARLRGGPAHPADLLECLVALVASESIGMPPDGASDQHIEGFVAEHIWHLLTLENALAFGAPVRVDGPDWWVTDSGGDGLAIHRVNGTLVFRLWESKAHTADSAVRDLVNGACRQVDSNALRYLARFSKVGQSLDDPELQQFYGSLLELWRAAAPGGRRDLGGDQVRRHRGLLRELPELLGVRLRRSASGAGRDDRGLRDLRQAGAAGAMERALNLDLIRAALGVGGMFPPPEEVQRRLAEAEIALFLQRGAVDDELLATAWYLHGVGTARESQHPANLIGGPQVRLGLVTGVPAGRQPIRQTARRPARGGQELQEVGQARPHGRDGLASQSTLAQQEARHVSHAERREIIDAHLVQIAQEPAGRPVFRDHGRLGVAAPTARSEVVVPERAELRGTTVLRRDHRPVDFDRPASQHLCHQHHRPANRLDSPVTDRFPQRPQPDPGLVRDEVDTHPVTRRVQAAPGQEGREPVQHDPLATDRALGPASLAQHRQDAADGDPGICLSHENHLCIR
jgi:hypothetical protein